MPSIIWTIVSFIIIFTIVVVSHEFGHFLIGRLNGMEVEEFSVGMGTAIFKKKFKHTVFVIRLLPIGGACRFKGMDLDIEEEELEGAEKSKIVFKETVEPGSYNAAPVWGRIATAFAGPLFNVLLAYLLCLIFCWFTTVDLPVIDYVQEGYPAQEAGLQAGDIVKKVNNQKIHLWKEIGLNTMLSTGKPLDIVYERDGVEYSVTVVPKYDEVDDRYYVGLASNEENRITIRNLSVFKYSAYEVNYWLQASYKSLGYLLFSGKGSVNDLAGPVGIANVIDETIEENKDEGISEVVINLLNITILLSVNLGVMNLIPLPALDGGRLVLHFIEAITGKKIPPEKEGLIHIVGFILIMILMVVVLFNDVKSIFIK